MNTQIARQASAFGLAAIVTIALFGGVDGLATRAHEEVAMARGTAPAATAVAAKPATEATVAAAARS